MFGSNNVQSVTLHIDLDPAGNDVYHVWRAPVAATVQRVVAMSNKTQNAGTAIAIELHNYGTAGTAIKSSGGTIGGGLGGTASASRLTADVPAASTSFTNPYLAAGEYVRLALTEEGSGWQAGENLTVQVEYVLGKQAANA